MMDTFKKPECVPHRKIGKGSQQDKHYYARLESSVASASASTSICSQQSKCDGYSYATSLFKSVINDSISSNESKILHDSSGLHSSVKKFGEAIWLDIVNSTREWQLDGFFQKHKELQMRATVSKGILHKKMMTFERWWCVLTDECDLCIQGFVENKNGVVQTEPIIKRMDSHTVASRNSLCKLKKFSGEECVPDLPHFIKSEFACGFPEDWKQLKRKWIMFLKEGETRDFQWMGNNDAAPADDCSPFPKPLGGSSQESSCEEFSDETQMRNLALSHLVANNKFTERIPQLDSNDAAVEKHGTETTGNWPHLEEERSNHVIAKRHQPQCSNTATTTKKNFLATKRSFANITDESENSGNEGTGIAKMPTNCQNAKNDNNQKKQSVDIRKTNTRQALVGNEILLENWLPVFDGKELRFSGVRSTGSAKKNHTTAAVKSRLKIDTVTLVDGNVCRLVGGLCDVHNCLPADITPKFEKGMPVNWRMVLCKWAIIKEKSATLNESSHTNNQQQGNLKKSSRGRILLQPVKHWLGETPSSVINRMADNSQEENDNVQEELLNREGSQALPAVETLIRTRNNKKCEMLKPEEVPPKSVKNAVNSKRKKNVVHRNVKKSKKELQSSRPVSDKDANSDMLDGSSCLDRQVENPTHFTNSERRYPRRSRNRQINAQKESSNAILNESDGIGKKEVSHSSHSTNKINHEKLKKPSSTIPVLDRDHEDSTNIGNTTHTIQKTKKKDTVCPLKTDGIDIDFTDFLGKPPQTLKQRKKLDKVVKKLSQKNKKNMDLFDDPAEGHENSRAGWNDFIGLNDDASFNTGEETPHSKILHGSYFKTPDTSPSQSIFQITPCNSNEVLRYVHQQKTKNNKAVKKKDTTKTKLPFTHSSAGNPVVDDVFAALLKGEPLPKHINSKGMNEDSDDSSYTSSSESFY